MKFKQISQKTNKKKNHMFGFCETFLTSTNCKENSNELNIDGYSCKNARKDRKNKKGGGLIAYFANHVKYQRLAYLENDLIESMWFKICPDNEQSFLLCFIY